MKGYGTDGGGGKVKVLLNLLMKFEDGLFSSSFCNVSCRTEQQRNQRPSSALCDWAALCDLEKDFVCWAEDSRKRASEKGKRTMAWSHQLSFNYPGI